MENHSGCWCTGTSNSCVACRRPTSVGLLSYPGNGCRRVGRSLCVEIVVNKFFDEVEGCSQSSIKLAVLAYANDFLIVLRHPSPRPKGFLCPYLHGELRNKSMDATLLLSRITLQRDDTLNARIESAQHRDKQVFFATYALSSIFKLFRTSAMP